MRDFVQPDVSAPAKARDVTFGIKRRSIAPRPRDITTTVLNGNGIAGSAANAAYELGQRGYKIVLPPTGQTQNAPNFQYFRTTVYYDTAQPRSKAAATKLANLFGDADVKRVARRLRDAGERRDGHGRRRAELPRVDRARAGRQDADAGSRRG